MAISWVTIEIILVDKGMAVNASMDLKHSKGNKIDTSAGLRATYHYLQLYLHCRATVLPSDTYWVLGP